MCGPKGGLRGNHPGAPGPETSRLGTCEDVAPRGVSRGRGGRSAPRPGAAPAPPAASPAGARLKAATHPLLPAPAGDARASRSFRASAAAAPSPERDAASPDGSADRPSTPGSPAVSYPRETQRGNEMSRGDVDRQVPGTERPRFKAVAPPFRHLRPKDTGA